RSTALPYLHSFPTRRSSDLIRVMAEMVAERAFHSTLSRRHNSLKNKLGIRGDHHIKGFRAHHRNAFTAQKSCERDFIEILRQGKDRKSTRLNSSHVSISYAV